jgi:hypothetical protein
MAAGRWSLSLVAVVGVFTTIVAAAVIWLLFTDPVNTSEVVHKAVAQGDVEPLMQALGTVIVGALRGLFGYL